MRRLGVVGVATLLGALPSLAVSAVQQGYLDGLVNVQPRQPTLVSNEFGNTFFPGHRLIVTVSGGPVDINFVPRSKEDCFLGFIDCKTRRWIEHGWEHATERPVNFRLVDDTGSVVGEFSTQAGRAEYEIPVSGAFTFNRKHRLLGMVADVPGRPPINPGRSQGQFTIRIDVTTKARANAVSGYLKSQKPTAQVLKQVWAEDPFLIQQNRRALSLAIVELAQSSYSPTNKTTARLHSELLEFAAEISPESEEVTQSVADMFLRQGNPGQAEAVLVKRINELRQKIASTPYATVDLNIQLASTHLRLAQTMEAARGYATAEDLAAIWAQYGSAYEIATEYGAQAVAAEALLGRAHSQRARNTLTSLRGAEADFRRARDLSPKASTGMPIATSQDGQHLLAVRSALQSRVRWESLEEGARTQILVDAGKVSLLPLAVAANGKVLAKAGDAVGWIKLSEQKPAFDIFGQYARKLVGAQTNGRSSILAFAPETFPGSLSFGLLKEELQRESITVDGKTPQHAELATDAERYLVIGPAPNNPAPSTQVPVELRQITARAPQAALRRVSLPMGSAIYKISPDGRRFAALSTAFVSPPVVPVRRLVVWDDGSATLEVSVKPLPVAPQVAPTTSLPAPPDDLLLNFDFSSSGQEILASTADGSIVRMPVREKAAIVKLNLPIDARPKSPFFVQRMFRVGSQYVAVEGSDPDGLFLQLVDTATSQARLVRLTPRIAGSFRLPAGYWQDESGKLGIVTASHGPLELEVVSGADGATRASGRLSLEDTGTLSLMNGGRYVCATGAAKLWLKNLTDQTESTIDIPPGLPAGLPTPVGGAPFLRPRGLCLPQATEDHWVFLAHFNGVLSAAVPYRGHQPQSGSEAMPSVPVELVDAERAAAARQKVPFVPPGFIVPDLWIPLGPHDPLAFDGFTFAVAIPRALSSEAMAKGDKWTSVPYVMLQQLPLTVRYARLPIGAMPVKILPPPIDKVVYIDSRSFSPQGPQFLWKPLSSDVGGRPINLPAVGKDAPFMTRIVANSAGTRLMFVRYYTPTDRSAQLSAEIEQRLYAITPGDLLPMDCKACTRRLVDPRSLSPEDDMGGQWGLLQIDRGLNYFATYSPDQALIHNVSENKTVASLPRRQLVWIGPDHAWFLSGPFEYSKLRYTAANQ